MIFALGPEGFDFPQVREAEHIRPAVVDGMTVVFLVAAAARLDLPGPRDGIVGAAEIAQVLRAVMRIAVREFLREPRRERALAADVELAAGRVVGQAVEIIGLAAIGHAVIDEPHGEPVVLHPVGDLAIMRLGHEQRQAEAMQQALERAFPCRFLGLDFQKLANKRHLCCREAEVVRKLVTQAHVGRRDVRAAAGERRKLALDAADERRNFLEVPLLVGDVAADGVERFFLLFRDGRDALGLRGKGCRIPRHGKAERLGKRRISLAVFLACGLLFLRGRNLALQCRQACAAILRKARADI